MKSLKLALVGTGMMFAAALLTPTAAAELTVAQIKANAETWPTQVKVTELLDYGPSAKIPAGTVVEFVGFHQNEVRFQYRQQFYLIEPELTDLVARANRIASGQAAAEGWRGRVADYLVRKGQAVTAAGFGPVAAKEFSDDTILVVYYGSSGCGYCGSAVPFLQQALEQIERRYPGRIKRVFSSGDPDNPAARAYARSLGAGWIAAPLGDQYLWNGLADLVPGAANALNYPAIALVTPKGKFLAAGMRRDNSTEPAAAVLRRLDELLAKGS